MDTTPLSQRISELTDLDPAEAVDAAEALADDLESSLTQSADAEERPTDALADDAGAIVDRPKSSEGEQPDA